MSAKSIQSFLALILLTSTLVQAQTKQLQSGVPFSWKVEAGEKSDEAIVVGEFNYPAKSGSILRIWASSESRDLAIRCSSGAGKGLRAPHSGFEATDPMIELQSLQKDASLQIRVLARGQDQGRCTIQVFESKVDPELDQLAEQLLAALDEAEQKFGRGEVEKAQSDLRDLMQSIEADRVADALVFVESVVLRIGNIASEYDEYDLAIAAFELLLDQRERTMPPRCRQIPSCRQSLAGVMFNKGDHAGGVELFLHAHAFLVDLLPAGDPDILEAKNNLAAVYYDLGKLDETATFEREVIAILEQQRPLDELMLADARESLTVTLTEMRSFEEALALHRKILDVRMRKLPPDDLDLARAKLNLANSLGELGDNQAAAVLELEALAVFEKKLPEDDETLLFGKSNYAGTLSSLGRYEEALAIERSALKTAREAFEADDPLLIQLMGNLAVTLSRLEYHEEALAMEREVLQLRLDTLPESHPHVAISRHNLAASLKKIGRWDEAYALLLRVYDYQLGRFPFDHEDLNSTRRQLAEVLAEYGRHDEALAFMELVLDCRQKQLGKSHRKVLKATLYRARLLKAIGRLEEALQLERDLVRRCEESKLDEALFVVAARGALANTLTDLGQFEEALELHRDQLEYCENSLPPDHSELSAVRNNMAVTLSEMGRPDEALELLRASLHAMDAVDSSGDRQDARTQGNIALILVELDRLQDAYEVSQENMKSWLRLTSGDDPDLATARGNHAGILEKLDRVAEALALQFLVLETETRTRPKGHPDLTFSRMHVADSLRRLGRVDDALEIELEMARGVPLVMTAFSDVLSARALADLGDNFDSAMSTVLTGAIGLSSPEVLKASFRMVETVANLDGFGRRLERSLTSKAGENALGMRSRIAAIDHEMQRLLGSRDEKKDRLKSLLTRRESLCVDLRRTLSKDAVLTVTAPPPIAIAESLDPNQAAIRFWSYDHWEYEGEELPRTCEPVGRHLLAFVIRKPGTLVRVDFGDVEPIESAIADWRECVTRGVAESNSARELATRRREAAEKRLRTLLVEPLVAAIPDSDSIVVAIDSSLSGIPLDALPVDDKGRLLGDLLRVSYRGSLRELVGGPAAPSTKGVLLTLGAVDFDRAERAERESQESSDDQSNEMGSAPAQTKGLLSTLLARRPATDRFEALLESKAEVEGIESLYRTTKGEDGVVRSLRGKNATVEALTSAVKGARFVHLATHAYFMPESFHSTHDSAPELADAKLARTIQALGSRSEQVKGLMPHALCGIALSGANQVLGKVHGLDAAEPRSMTGSAVANLNLEGCDLAVLSACEGGVGLKRLGQGTASLQESLHVAGARSVVTSLWRVPDGPTRELMLEFYRQHWVEKLSKVDALWAAKLKLRRMENDDGEARYDLLDWAGWVLSGDTD